MNQLISCIIVDDEPLAVKLLESFVTKTPDLRLLGSFTDSVEAINAIKEQKPDLLFLDIQMPDLNGMELAHMIPPTTRVIFTTAFKEYAFESYLSAITSSSRQLRKQNNGMSVSPLMKTTRQRASSSAWMANCVISLSTASPT